MLRGGKYAIQKCPFQRKYVKRIVDNGWIVLYNPIPSRCFQCHLNVKVCISRVGWYKYLFKYVFKGRDRVTVELQNDKLRYDELFSFMDARCVSASEAVWRALGNRSFECHSNIVRMDVHLPDLHTVFF